MFIHINGWPGVGKLTVARDVARLLPARVLDNHALHDVAARLCDRGTTEYWELYYQVRDLAYRWIERTPTGQALVMTNALLMESDREREAWEAVKRLAAHCSRPLVSITLDCSLEENVRRIGSADRRHRKLTDHEPLVEWRSRYRLLTDATVPSLRIDNSNRIPEQVAADIVAFVRPLMSAAPP
jgi:thymidylate kinase